jgi:two-component system, chemotaxis family, CheB/CheR fusion protein
MTLKPVPSSSPTSVRPVARPPRSRTGGGGQESARREKFAQASVGAKAFPIVGIGASAGGLEAFTQVLRHLPADTGMAFVLVQHLDPVHESALTSLLARATKMPVTEVTPRLRVRPNQVYVIPPNVNLTMRVGVLHLQPRPEGRAPHNSIDTFLVSLAEDQQERAIGVILSGTATDGTLGLEAIKAEGGITLAQDESAKFDAMPRHAVAAGCVDLVLAPAAIAEELVRLGQFPGEMAACPVTPPDQGREGGTPGAAGKGDALGAILQCLRDHTGVDFSLYKPSTLERRINRRMALNRQNTTASYAAFLKDNDRELDALYADVLIAVTGFFRNPEAFEGLKRKVFPALLASRGAGEPMRVWTLGCSTGQEAYSIAMAYAEFIAKLSDPPRLQVFATDLNEASLVKARRGHYAKALVQGLSPARLKQFFVEDEGGYRITKALRESVVFARQNALNDPPFSRMDLITCRNLLIYLESSLQRRLMPAFHYALKPGGFLFLGASETISGHAELFGSVDAKHKLFIRKAAATPSFRLPLPPFRSDTPPAPPTVDVGPAPARPEGWRGEIDLLREADRLSVRQFAPPGVVINAELQVMQFRGATGAYLEPPSGRATYDFLKMVRAGLLQPLRTAIAEAKRMHQPVRLEQVRMLSPGGTVTIALHVIPLAHHLEACFLVLFEEAAAKGTPVTAAPIPPAAQTAPTGTAATRRRIDRLERDLAESREYLRSIQEQQEASTEELSAASEEMQSANEELQSINEELETSKEELESTNEELAVVNEEMLHRNAELDMVNSDLRNLQESTHAAILLVGRDLSIRRFTPLAEKAFNLNAGDIGRSLIHLRHSLVLPDLPEVVTQGINNLQLPDREVQDRDGRWYLLRVRPYVTLDHQVDGAVLALIDIDELKHHEQAVTASRDYAEAIIRTAREPFLILHANLKVKSASEAFYTTFRTTAEQTEGHLLEALDQGRWYDPSLRRQLLEVFSHHRPLVDFELKTDLAWSGPRVLLLNARRLDTAATAADAELLVLDIEDVTERHEGRAALRRSEIRYRRLFEAAKDGIMILDPATREITDANPYMTQLLGYSRAELVGKELWEIGLWKDEAASQAAFLELQRNGFIRYDDLPLKTKQGERCEVEFVSNLYEEDGHQVVQCNIRDITVRKQTEVALRETMGKLQLAQETAERSSRAKDEFLAALSHELRTPLTPILLTAAALAEDRRLPAEVHEQLQMWSATSRSRRN